MNRGDKLILICIKVPENHEKMQNSKLKFNRIKKV
jgi:hypothetical protein